MWKSALKRLTGLGALAIAFAVASPPAAAQETQGDAEPAAKHGELANASLILQVDGLTCPFCAYGLEKRLRGIPAIDELVIRVSDGLIQIRLVDGGALTDEELEDAVERAGFTLREIRRLDSGENR